MNLTGRFVKESWAHGHVVTAATVLFYSGEPREGDMSPRDVLDAFQDAVRTHGAPINALVTWGNAKVTIEWLSPLDDDQ